MPIFRYKGAAENYKFLKGVKYLVQLWGADGGEGGGGAGKGGYAYATMVPTADLSWYITVGGCPDEMTNGVTGGYNGGGNGGAIGSPYSYDSSAYSNGYWEYNDVRSGGGGGGATDLKTNTSSTQSVKMLVAGGGGGGGGYGFPGGDVGNDGWHYPRNEYTDTYGDYGTLTFKDCEGGTGATESAAGKGGRAPYYPNFKKVYDGDINSHVCYCPSGGGGGGGYCGGGGGSSGTIAIYGAAYTGVAGGNGNTNGVGGAGGSCTSSKTGRYSADEGAGGGGGSDFFRSANANFKTGNTYMNTALRPPRPVNTLNGVASVYPVYSEPVIKDIYKDGNYIVVIFGKTLNNGIEEMFYIQGISSANKEWDTVDIGYSGTSVSTVIIKDDQDVIKRYPIETTTADWIFTFSMNNGFYNTKKVFNYKIINRAPGISFNNDNLPSINLQGSVLKDICKITADPGMNYRYETTLIINGESTITLSHDSEKCSIDLPYMFNGVDGESYTLKIKARVCQTEDSLCGVGTIVWSNWIESHEMTIVTSRPQINTIEFTTDFKNKAIEQETNLYVAWEERVPATADKYYKLMLFKDGELFQSFDTTDTSRNVVMDYPLDSCYKFGVSIVTNGVLSEVAYSDEFYLTDITSDVISFTSDLVVSSNITKPFDRIEVYINDELRLMAPNNVNEQFPVVFFKNGDNDILVKTYVTKTEYFPTRFSLHIAYDEDSLIAANTLDIISTLHLNGNEIQEIEMIGDDISPVDLCEAEKSMYLIRLANGGIVEEITQKITIIKKDEDSTDKIKIFDIFGYTE